jgi:outer membrane protein assembly factor BamE (lipoprotein component of BamABCDE complex)
MLALAGATSMMTACVAQYDTHGEQVDPKRLAVIHPGVQTKDDVAQLLGSPSSVAVFDDETWYYISDTEERRSVFERDVVERQIVTVQFDTQGVVKSVDLFGKERSQEVELVERETPSFGESVNFLDQVLGNIGRFNKEQQPRR